MGFQTAKECSDTLEPLHSSTVTRCGFRRCTALHRGKRRLWRMAISFFPSKPQQTHPVSSAWDLDSGAVQSQADILEAVNKAIAGSEDVSEYCHPQNGMMIDNYDLTWLILYMKLFWLWIHSFIHLSHLFTYWFIHLCLVYLSAIRCPWILL